MDNPFDYSAPRPYSWKTDEFQTQNEARPQRPTEPVKPLTDQFNPAQHNFSPAPLAYQQTRQMGQPFRCPHCMSQYLPRLERRISTAGWVTFSVLLVMTGGVFCWVGLLIKEDVQICQSCNSKVG